MKEFPRISWYFIAAFNIVLGREEGSLVDALT